MTDAEPLFNSSDAREDFLSHSGAVSQVGCLLEADVTVLAIRVRMIAQNALIKKHVGSVRA